MAARVRIERRFRGPDESGNGGYSCGILGRMIGSPAEVTLRLPPPLERPLDVFADGEGARMTDRSELVAEEVGWPLARDGRKFEAGPAIFSADGAPLARARATWIELRRGRGILRDR